MTITRLPVIRRVKPSDLAREVQASRKLIADLRALHRPDSKIDPWCDEDWFSYPCRTIRMIDEAGL